MVLPSDVAPPPKVASMSDVSILAQLTLDSPAFQQRKPRSAQGSAPSIGAETTKNKLERFLQEITTIQQQESRILEQLKNFSSVQEKHTEDKENPNFSVLGDELKHIFRQKENAFAEIFPVEKKCIPRAPTADEWQPGQFSLRILQQPSDVAVVNRYISPAPKVSVVSNGDTLKSSDSTWVVNVSLCYSTSGEELFKTTQGTLDLLQGIKRVPVESLSPAVFTKLKVMEVSSKHRHQAFCLVFSLEEYLPNGTKGVIARAKSSPFLVQSRPTKRKPSDTYEAQEWAVGAGGLGASVPSMPLYSPGVSPRGGPPSLSQSLDSQRGACAVSSSESPSDASSDEEDDGDDMMDDSSSDSKPFDVPEEALLLARAAGEKELVIPPNYIDITDLLVLPQKEAARKLGISESMLCKRFKECTRRKWPYRYLRKIDKIIKMLCNSKSDGFLAKEDQEKLEQLRIEREECIRPVKIRITQYDRLNFVPRDPKLGTPPVPRSSAKPAMRRNTSKTQLTSQVKAPAHPLAAEPKYILGTSRGGDLSSSHGRQSLVSSEMLPPLSDHEDEIPVDVLHTLEMLKGGC